jgi:purine-binding chemotaxis protein CheW
MDLTKPAHLLREEFDRSFAAPSAETRIEVEPILAVRLKGDLHGLRLHEIDGVEKAAPIVPLRADSPGLRGLSGYRGAILPVYDLGALLGYEEAREAPRWLFRCGKGDPIALAVEEFAGYVTVPATAFHAPYGRPRRHVEQFARIGDAVAAIVSVPSIVGGIREGS